MSNEKKQIRAQFRTDTFKRDKYCCVGCGKKATPNTAEDALDAHHITNRKDMPGGGYVKENGVSLCKGTDGTSCHEKAEEVLQGIAEHPGFSPEELYAKIGSSYDLAVKASQKLE
jgi:5-methylcytosine-specific restriction endonuclease McrA